MQEETDAALYVNYAICHDAFKGLEDTLLWYFEQRHQFLSTNLLGTRQKKKINKNHNPPRHKSE